MCCQVDWVSQDTEEERSDILTTSECHHDQLSSRPGEAVAMGESGQFLAECFDNYVLPNTKDNNSSKVHTLKL